MLIKKYFSFISNKKVATYLLILALGLSFYAGLEVNTIQAQPAASEKSAVTDKNPGADANSKAEKSQEQKPAEKKDAAEATSVTSIWSLFQAGGPFMWPLLLASIISLMVVMERFYFYATTKLTNKKFQQELADSLKVGGVGGATKFLGTQDKLSISHILSEGLKISKDPELFSKGVEREAGAMIARSERGLAVLAAISTIAPLVGFLGTVSGMIGAFDAIATADVVNAKVVAGGIKEALITTATGLIVAIPAMTFFQYFSGRVNGFITDVEQAANNLYKRLLTQKEGMSANSNNSRPVVGAGVQV